MKPRIHWLVAGSVGLAASLTTGGTLGATTDPAVVSVSPAPNAVGAPRRSDLIVRFDVSIDPGSVTDKHFAVFGRWSGVMPGALRVEAEGRQVRFVPARPFMAGEFVTVSVSRNVRSTDGLALARGYSWGFWIQSGVGTLDLTRLQQLSARRPGEKRIQTYGAYAGDFDGDGYSDLAVPNEQSNDVRIFMNDRTGRYRDFVVLDYPRGSVPSPNEGADFDRDGVIDFVVGNSGNDLVSAFRGRGDGTFEHQANYQAERMVRGVCILDLNGDGYDDLATANQRGDRRRGSVSVLVNDGTGRFEDAVEVVSPGRAEKTCAVGDANEDGVMDLFLGAYASREVVLFLGDGEGGLTFATKVPAGGAPWMIVTGDVNGDGHVDVLSANRKGNNMGVLLGDGRGGLQPVTTFAVGKTPLAIDVGDIDGDGDLDAVTSNLGSADFTLYENVGRGTFANRRTFDASAAGSCAIIHDRDGDGDLDVTGVDELDDMLFLFENRG